MDHESAPVRPPTFREALRFWLKLGFISFGGPTGQIAIMHAELVDRRRWISETRFLHALNYCMLLPGPEAQQLATYIGWLLHRTLGGLVAGTLFVLPSAILLWMLSYVYVRYGAVPWIAAVFEGLKPAVAAIVVHAVFRIGKRVLRNPAMWIVAVAAFSAIYFAKVPFPIIILAAGIAGLLGERIRPEWFRVLKPHSSRPVTGSILDDHDTTPDHARTSWTRALRAAMIGLILWWAPVAVAAAWLGRDHTLSREGFFFSKAAVVTFGGAYAVLPYVAQQAVERFHWLSAPQMLDGLGLAETTPGPLIMVLQFIGFLGGWHQPGSFSPLLAATLGAALTTWVTFVPCFLWIFLGAPYVERLRGKQNLTAALSAITAAVVGVVLNLAVWFGYHVLIPQPGQANWFAVVLGGSAFAVLVGTKFGVVPVVLGSGVAGLIFHGLTRN